MGGTGKVVFQSLQQSPLRNSFSIKEWGKSFDGSWYWEAERSFRQAAHIDHRMAMAYWGMAMANLDDPSRAWKFIGEAMEGREKVTRGEKLYIERLAIISTSAPALKRVQKLPTPQSKLPKRLGSRLFLTKLEAIIGEFPGDIEAKAFLVHFRSNWRMRSP